MTREEDTDPGSLPLKTTTKGWRAFRPWLWRLAMILLLVLFLVVCRTAYQSYEADTELEQLLSELDRAEPGWHLQDIEAAREPIPEEENSVRVIVSANERMPQDWPPLEFVEHFTNLTPDEQLAPDVFAQLKKELTALQPAVREARKLADMQRGRYRLIYERLFYLSRLPDLQSARRINRLLTLDAMRYAQDRDMKSAVISCRLAFNVGRSVGDEPSLLSQLVRTACVNSACLTLERVLAQGEPPAEELATMQRLLDSEDAFPDFLIAARGERAGLHSTFETVENGDEPVSKLAGTLPDWEDSALGWFAPERFQQAHPTMLALMNRYVEITRLPQPEQAEAERQFDQEIRRIRESEPLAVLLIPAIQKVGEASRRKHANLRCMMVALAVERYRQEHKKWPDRVGHLCPTYLKSLPSDPFDGKPLRYRHLEDGIILYSVGHDRVDNGGNLNREWSSNPGVDIGYRVWDTTKRRKSPGRKPPAENPLRQTAPE